MTIVQPSVHKALLLFCACCTPVLAPLAIAQDDGMGSMNPVGVGDPDSSVDMGAMGGSTMSTSPEMARMWALADADDATIEAENDGLWSDKDTWNLDRIPTMGDRVLIAEGRSIQYDILSTESLRTLRLDGTLAFATDKNTTLVLDTLIGGMKSVLRMGTAASPIDAAYTARIVIKDYDDPAVAGDDGFERSDATSADFDPAMLGLGLLTHGRFETAGTERAHGGVLAKAPASGDTRIRLKFNPTGWQTGDEIVIAGTSRDALGDEKRTITAIDNRRITLDRALEKDHGVVAHTKDALELAVHVVNLERNVIIETAEDGRAATKTSHTYTNDTLGNDYTIDLFHDRGHVMFMHSNNVDIRHTRFRALGRTSKHGAIDDNVFDDDGKLTYTGINPRARYALHFHRAGLEGTPGRVEGSVADGTPGWCYVNHGSNADFINNVAYDCDGAGFVTERGDELGSFVSNISIRNTADEGKNRTALRFQARKPIDDFGFGGHGYWLQGINVIARDNIASGAGREAFSLYPLLFDNADKTLFSTAQIAPAHQASFSRGATPDEVPLHTFKGNVAYGSNIGLMIGEHRPDAVSLVDTFTAWMVNMGTSFNYSDSIRFDDLTMIGNLDTPEGLGAFAHHGTAQVTMNRPHVEGFAIGIQLPRAGNQAVDLGRFKYSAIRDAYLNNVLNLHVLQIRSHDFLHADIERPTFGTMPAAPLAHGITALAAIDGNDDLDIDASNRRSNGFAELATEVAENRFTTQQDYYLHYTQTAGPTVDTRHQRDSFLPRRITITDKDNQQWRLFFKQQQVSSFIPFPTSVYKEGVDYDLDKPFDPDAPRNNRNSNLPAQFLDKTVGQIADQFQRDASNAAWADFAWAKDRTGSRWEVDAAVDYPGFALVPGGRLLPSDYTDDPRYASWPRSTNLVAMRVDDLPDYTDYAGRDLEAEADLLDPDACANTDGCLSTLAPLGNTQRQFDTDSGNGRSLLVDGAFEYPAPFSLEQKSLTWHGNVRALNVNQGTVIDAGNSDAGFASAFVNGKLNVTLRTGKLRYALESPELEAGKWFHVAVMINQGLGKAVLFIDGTRVDSQAITPFRSSGGSTWRIGAPYDDADSDTFLGFIDDMAFSERTYTDAGLASLAAVNVQSSPSRGNRDADKDGTIDILDLYPLDAKEYRDSDDDGIGDTADLDDDADGIPDLVETQYGLDPLSAADANEDLDSDGISNLLEYTSGTRLDKDDVDPWVTAPIDIDIPARGTLSSVDLGVAQAGDTHDGTLIASPSPAGPYASGLHEILWTAEDAAGNSAQAAQQLIIQPQAFVTGNAIAVEGSTLQLSVTLNGDAATYPVRIPYQLGGSADSTDYQITGASDTATVGTLEIDSGRQATLEITILEDNISEGEDTIVVSLDTPENAVLGDGGRHTITIHEANVAPVATVALYQDDTPVDVAIIGVDDTRLVPTVIDHNTEDTHTYAWNQSDATLLAVSSIVNNVLVIRAQDLDEGIYPARLTVTDDGDGQLTATALFNVVVAAKPEPTDDETDDTTGQPTENVDTGDGTDPEDNKINPWSLAIGDDGLSIETTPLHQLKPGPAALATGGKLATLGANDHIKLDGSDTLLHERGVPTRLFASPVFDIAIHDVPLGQSTTIVFPVKAGIPGGSAVRRLSSTGQWETFSETGGDSSSSTRANATACPVATDDDYAAGLNKGDHCVALHLVDGGDNDADGMADGVVRLLFGLGFVQRSEPIISAANPTTALPTRITSSGEHPVLAFTLTSDDVGAELHGFELATSGELNEADDVDAVILYADTNDNNIPEAIEALGSGHFASDNATLKFTLTEPYGLAVGRNSFLVTYVFRGTHR